MAAHELDDLISFEGFSFSKWREHEREILKPRLEEKGYTKIQFGMAEEDSFGPLVRSVTMLNSDGERVTAFYG